MPAFQHVVKRQLQPLATFRFRPERLVIIDDPVEIATGLAGITDNIAGNLAVRINPNVHWPNNHGWTNSVFRLPVFLLGEIRSDLEREDTAIMIMPENRFVGKLDGAT